MKASPNCPFSKCNVRQVHYGLAIKFKSRGAIQYGVCDSRLSGLPGESTTPPHATTSSRTLSWAHPAPLAHGPPAHYTSTWPALRAQPHPPPSAPRPFPTTRPPLKKFPPKRPSVPQPETLEGSEPRSQERTSQGLVGCKGCGLGCGLRPERGHDARGPSFPGRKEGREGTPTAGGRKLGPETAGAAEFPA